MKPLATIGKNLKLLFRSKESAYTILFGPLLIILIVSFAFMGSSDDYTMRVAVHELGHSGLSERTVQTLGEKGYLVSVYPDNESCVASVRDGAAHACIAFGEGEEGNESVPVTFYLDFSRLNIVYRILDDLSGEVDLQADAIRAQLATGALLRMQTASELVGESLEITRGLQASLDAAAQNLTQAESGLEGIPDSGANVTDIAQLRGYQQGLAQYTHAVADEALGSLREARTLLRDIDHECADCSPGIRERVQRTSDRIDAAEQTITYLADEATPEHLEQANLLLSFALDDLEGLQQEMAAASSSGEAVHGGVSGAAQRILESKSALGEVESRLSYTRDFLRGEATDPSVLSAPVTTSVVSVTASDDTLSFAYPYLLMLVIMFIGMLLASMLIVTDKTSRAAFRNFTTPTSGRYHIAMAFLTAFLILVVEVGAMLLLSGLFVAQPLLLNFLASATIICVAIAVFTFLGMIIGYLSSTQEAAMISSISIGSVLLFVSNLVIPIEGMASLARTLSAFNPYIVLSELLKKSMLYGVPAGQIARELLAMAAFLAALIIMTLAVQRYIRDRYFKEEQRLLPAKRVAEPLELAGREVHDEIELMEALDAMTRADFEHIVDSNDNPIARWVAQELRNRRLARQLRTRSKERMILRLDNHLKRHGKRMRRER